MHKKVWVYILIIVVVSSLFPSILIARANDGDGGGGAGGIPGDDDPPTDIPDLEYTFENAPFPGKYGQITEGRWQQFINRAEELGHTEIKKLDYVHIIRHDDSIWDVTIYHGVTFYSTNGTDIEEIKEVRGNSIYYGLHYIDNEDINILKSNSGHITNEPGPIFNNDVTGKDGRYGASTYYRADLANEYYKEKPDRYNADPLRGYGMYILRPEYGEWVNIPHALGVYRDYVEIEINVPQKYEWQEGYDDNLFYYGNSDLSIQANFAIKLNYENVKKIHGSTVAGRDGTWILPYQIELKQAYYSNTYPHTATFIAKVPIDHAANFPSNESIITADLYIYDSYNSHIDYSVNLPEYYTWTRYLTYLGTVDADGDGYDDRTGHPVNQSKPVDDRKADKPNKDDYDDGILGTISYYFDTFIWYIKQPFVFIADLISNIINWISSTIDGWIDDFSSIFTTLFSFLPSEIILMLALGFATMMIITIIRAIRGS